MKKIFCICLVILSCFAFSTANASNTFYDTIGTKYEGVVERISELGIINGVSEKTYAFNKSVTRAELAKIIVKMRDIESYASDVEYKKIFSDVKKSDWFYPYVIIASDLELVNGYEDGTFKPNQEVTYAELIVILLRNLGYTRISMDSPNGWYWNYVVRMREIGLNNNVGEFDYTKPAKRGDTAIFVWNALITNRWSVVSENENEGFTYTYSEKTPLETFFDEYKFIDNKKISNIIGQEGKAKLVIDGKVYDTNEKIPLYVLGGNVTALYKENEENLIGVTYDEDYDNTKIISGPLFYLKEQGYTISKAKTSASYGLKNKATYAYLVIDKNKNEILRAVYVDASNSVVVNSISINNATDEEGTKYEEIKINDEFLTTLDSALVKNGLNESFKSLKKKQVVTNLGDGLYIYSDVKVKEEIEKINAQNEIWLAGDKYIILDSCACYAYNDKEAENYKDLSASRLKKYVGQDVTVYLNIAEEVCMMEFGKTEALKENNQFVIGYVTRIRENNGGAQTIEVRYKNDSYEKFTISLAGDYFASIGDLVSIDRKTNKCSVIERDRAFDNDISVKYKYDAKKIESPMIGEYMVNDDTEYYKVDLIYDSNSTTTIKDCKIDKLELDNIQDLMVYKITLVYNEEMEIIRVYAINEINKFENQIALVKNKKKIRLDKEKYEYNVTLSVTNSSIHTYEVTSSEFEKYNEGDIVIFSNKVPEKLENITYEAAFKHEFIGFKRDLVVEKYDKKQNKVYLNDGTIMNLNDDIYNWNGSKINMNAYRFVMAKVSKIDDDWKFNSLSMESKEKLDLKVGDRIAIGELNGIIVIYRGYEE